MQVYTAQAEMDESVLLKQLQGMYGYTDDSKDWLLMRKAHLQKWKIIKKQAAKAALRGRGGGGRSGRKQAFSWKWVANIQGEGLTLGGVWTRAEAANHFAVDDKFENDNPRGGNVSINSKVCKCRKYFADRGEEEDRIYIRVVEMKEGTEYKVEQGYPLGDGDGDDDEDDPSEAPPLPASDVNQEEVVPHKGRSKRAAAAPAPEPAASKVDNKDTKKKSKQQ